MKVIDNLWLLHPGFCICLRLYLAMKGNQAGQCESYLYCHAQIRSRTVYFVCALHLGFWHV